MLSVDATFSFLLATQPDDHHRARHIAVMASHRSNLLKILSIILYGLCNEDNVIRVAVGLRLGASLCGSQQCKRGIMVNKRGNHGLSCKRSAKRTLKPTYCN